MFRFDLISNAEIDMYSDDQHRFGYRKQPPSSQPKPARQVRHFFCNDVIVFDVILQGVGVFDLYNQNKPFRKKLSIRISVVLVPTQVLYLLQ